MSGFYGGVQRLLNNHYEWDIKYIHFFNHQLHLAVMEIADNYPIISRLFDLAIQLYIFIKRLLMCLKYEGLKLKRLLF